MNSKPFKLFLIYSISIITIILPTDIVYNNSWRYPMQEHTVIDDKVLITIYESKSAMPLIKSEKR
jgi:hypothetical protein